MASIQVDQETKDLVEELLVRSGYEDASQLLKSLIRRWPDDLQTSEDLQESLAAIEEGIADAQAGRTITREELERRIEEKMRKLSQ